MHFTLEDLYEYICTLNNLIIESEALEAHEPRAASAHDRMPGPTIYYTP
jgi:hypothetical protein